MGDIAKDSREQSELFYVATEEKGGEARGRRISGEPVGRVNLIF